MDNASAPKPAHMPGPGEMMRPAGAESLNDALERALKFLDHLTVSATDVRCPGSICSISHYAAFHHSNLRQAMAAREVADHEYGPYRVAQYGGVRPFSVEGPGITYGHGPLIETRESAEIMAHDFAECYRAGVKS